MKIDLGAAPFFLDEARKKWVSDTLANLTENEKIGQLFCPIAFSTEEGYLRQELLR